MHIYSNLLCKRPFNCRLYMRADDLNSLISDTHKLKTMRNIHLSNTALLFLRFYVLKKPQQVLKNLHFDIDGPLSPKWSVCVCLLRA